MVRFVVTYAFNDWDVNGCIGVFDDPDKAIGAIITNVFDIWDGRHEAGTDPKFTFEFVHDHGYDNYYHVNITYEGEVGTDTYRVFYLRE